MLIEGKKIGVAMTGSFCMFHTVIPQIENLVKIGCDVTPIFSNNAQSIDSRFGNAADFVEHLRQITGKNPVLTIKDAEPIGPKKLFDILIVVPCTGNTAAKIANGITDTPVLMAVKAHLRNERPLLLGIASNDGLGMNMQNIGLLLNSKHIFFIPFGQDNPAAKPNSLISHMEMLIPALECALEEKQYQPVIISPYQ